MNSAWKWDHFKALGTIKRKKKANYEHVTVFMRFEPTDKTKDVKGIFKSDGIRCSTQCDCHERDMRDVLGPCQTSMTKLEKIVNPLSANSTNT